nr:MAG TPA: hypothetical protein [Caudoviricetes sp.]
MTRPGKSPVRWEPPLRDRFGLWRPGRRRTRETENMIRPDV